MKYLLLLCYLITPVSAWFSDNNIDKIQEHYDKRLMRVEAFMDHYGIQKKNEIAESIQSLRPDLSMLAILAGIIPDDESLEHYFTGDGRIVENPFNSTRSKHTTVWELLDEHNIPYDKEAKMPYCGQALGVGVYTLHSIFDYIVYIIDDSCGISTPMLHDIFILKNEEDPNAEPKFISRSESLQPMLKILKRFFPDAYAKLKGHTIYHSDNSGPVSGRSSDFSVLRALLNAIYNRPCRQLVFTGQIKDDGSLYPIGAARIKNKAAKALKMPIVVELENCNELRGDNSVWAPSLERLAGRHNDYPDLDDEALERINSHKIDVKEYVQQKKRIRYKALACYCVCWFGMVALDLYNNKRKSCAS